jgi:hypothetical protein
VSAVLPDGAILLAKDDQGRLYQFGDQLVIERSFNGKRIETRLPVGDLDWLWRWAELFRDACDTLAHHQLR